MPGVAVSKADTTAASRSMPAIPAGVPTGSRRLRERREVRVAFALDCCDRGAVGYVATTAGISAADVRDLMTRSVECQFGRSINSPRRQSLFDSTSCEMRFSKQRSATSS